jgi:hypothetical protein
MEAISNYANEREIPARTNKPIFASTIRLAPGRFMRGEEDAVPDNFLDDIHSVRHIGAVSRRQKRPACAAQPLVRAVAARRRRIANPFNKKDAVGYLPRDRATISCASGRWR